MEQGKVIDGYEILHSIRLNAVTHAVAQNTTSEDESYRIYKIGSANVLGLADCEVVHETSDYLNAMREFTQQINAGLDSISLDRAYRGLSPTFDDAPFKAGDCLPNSSKLDYTGQVVAIKAKSLSPEYRAASQQLHIATGGFGCSPNASGRAVYCTNVYDGKEGRFDRSDILGVVKSGEIPPWAQDKIVVLRETQPPQQQSKAVPSGEKESAAQDKPSVIDEIKQSQKEARERPVKPKDVPSKKKSDPDL